jgi:hypothetical protein
MPIRLYVQMHKCNIQDFCWMYITVSVGYRNPCALGGVSSEGGWSILVYLIMAKSIGISLRSERYFYSGSNRLTFDFKCIVVLVS